MVCQTLFSVKNKKSISKCCLLNFYPACKVLRNMPSDVKLLIIFLAINLSFADRSTVSVKGA